MATVVMSSHTPVECVPKAREANTKVDNPPLHRIAEVREQQGLTLRTVSRRTGVDVRELKRQDGGQQDLSLSELYHGNKL